MTERQATSTTNVFERARKTFVLQVVGLGLLLVGTAGVAADEKSPLAFVLEVIAVVGLVLLVVSAAHLTALTSQQKKENQMQELEAEKTRRTRITSELSEMLLRADNVVATLANLVDHADEHPEFALLTSLLKNAGIESWGEDAPKASARKLGYSGSWYLVPADDEIGSVTFQKLMQIELSLNLCSILDDREQKTTESLAAAKAALDCVHLTSPQDSEMRASVTDILLAPELGEAGGEWRCRMSFADFIEAVKTPFRLSVKFQSSVAAHTLCAQICVPSPSCFAPLEPSNGVEREKLARGYALRSALLVARGAFESSTSIERVCVNCHDELRNDIILSLDVTKETLTPLFAALNGTSCADELPQSASVRIAPQDKAWGTAVIPFMRSSDPALNDPERRQWPEEQDAVCSEELEEATGAHNISELGINDPREVAWHKLSKSLGSSTAEAVSTLIDLQHQTDDALVKNACERTVKALVDGTIESASKDDVAPVFLTGEPLDKIVEATRRNLGSDSPSEELAQQSTDQLVRALEQVYDSGIYQDTDEEVHRFFNSANERIVYNLCEKDDDRRVVLVPDTYYVANLTAANALCAFDRYDDALPYADELCRLSPYGEDAALNKAAVLIGLSRTFDAEDLIKRTIDNAINARQLSRCFAELAYVEWKLGRGMTAVACYERALQVCAVERPLFERSYAELRATDPTLSELTEEQATAEFEEKHIPFGNPEAIRDRLIKALAACVDSQCFLTAGGIGKALMLGLASDPLQDVVASLEVQQDANA